MACIDEVRLNDVGTKFQFTIYECIDGTATVVDVSLADSIEIYFKKPTVNGIEGAVLQKVGVKSNGGADGIVHYITIANDIDTVGKWEAQAKVVMTTGTQEFSSDIIDFKVVENLS